MTPSTWSSGGSRRGGTPPPVEDTALVAYLLNPARTNYKLEEVAGELLGEGPGLAPPGSRARWIWELWAMAPRALKEVGLLELYENIERPLVPVLAHMERDGIRVDQQRLDEFSRELELALERATREIYALAGGEFNIGSPKQLATILFEKLKLPPLRKTKTGYSTDADVLEQLALGHELPAKIIEHRTLAKLKSTYADALPTLINARTGRIHPSFNQLVAVTGRLSSSNPNAQNIPIRTELGRRIRAAFVAEAGHRFLAADYSQIELRILAHVSGEESLIEAFRRGEDIHRRTAAEVFGVPLDQVTSQQRDVAKTTNFAVIYGVTAFGLSRGLDMTQKQAQEYLNQFFARHPKVKAYLERTVAEGRERGYVSTLLGRRRYLPELRSGNPNLRGFGERMATNAPIQGTAADLVKIAMVRVARELAARGLRSRMLLQVHDELLFEVPEGELGALEALVVEVMESALELSVPLEGRREVRGRLGRDMRRARGMRRFLLVGLTGGIATGKSTVSQMFAHLGAKVVDADLLAREVVMPGQPALAEIVAEFGADVLQPDGHLDRKRLGAIVFSDPERRKRLEQITHPAIHVRQQRVLSVYEEEAFEGVVLWDAAVLIESGGHKRMDKLVVVLTDPATELARLMARDGMGDEEARGRIATQMPVADKAKLADYVIDNSGTRAETERRVREVYEQLLADLKTARAAGR